jgi:hypothetical protein
MVYIFLYLYLSQFEVGFLFYFLNKHLWHLKNETVLKKDPNECICLLKQIDTGLHY